MGTSKGEGFVPHDDYLDWGLATEFRFLPGGARAAKSKSVGLLIQWKSPADAKKARSIADSHGVVVPEVYAGGKMSKVRQVWSVSVPVENAAAFVQAANPLATLMELSTPVSGPVSQPRVALEGLKSDSKILAAVLDDGCAFANSRFLSNGGPRTLWLWNQDPEAIGFPLDVVSGPSPACDFNYGGQWSQQDLKTLITQKKSQELVYSAAGLAGLRRAAAHGAHVTDLLCGAEDWQFVFVQFPLAAIDDPSGLWLKRYALDGLMYIMECIGAQTKTIVVNLSWGPQTGPHDGTSILEVAIDDLVADQKALGNDLFVSLAAGNSYSSRAHAQVDYLGGGSLSWMVPPDGRTPAFLEIWWPNGIAPADARLRVAPPGSTAVDILPGQPWAQTNWYARLRKVGNSTKALLVVHPTEDRDPTFRGQHGKWTVEFKPGRANVKGDIHVYLARADHNMGARRRAKASYLTDAALAVSRFVPPDKRFDEAAGSVIRREGTLNGIATGAKSIVAAGYRFSDASVAPYSSSGPTRGPRTGPDNACVTDRSAAVAGVRATGVRSGTTVRLMGTSMAAPQLARELANTSKAIAPGPNLPHRIGAGRLKPAKDLLHKE